MNLLTVENISKSYGELVLFSHISFGINKDQKIALIAKNGSGKTSILNIMSGKDVSETGQVVSRKGIKISFCTRFFLEDNSFNSSCLKSYSLIKGPQEL